MSILRTVGIFRVLTLSIVASAIAQAGVVTVSAVVTPGSGLFQYDYSIANGTADDLFDLDIAVTPGIAITDLSAPAGFDTAYDSGLGLVSFLEDTASFDSTPLSGFIFDSSIAPATTTFTAQLLDSDFDIIPTPGTTTGPVAAAAPEPASLTLCALCGAALLFWRKRCFASLPRPDSN